MSCRNRSGNEKCTKDLVRKFQFLCDNKIKNGKYVDRFLYNKTNQMHQFPKFTPVWNSTCFGQFLCPSSGVYSLYTRHCYMSYRFEEICYYERSHERKKKSWEMCKASKLRNLKAGFLDSTRVGTLIVATIYLQLIQNRYMFRSFTVLHCNHQHCVQPVASDVEVVGYL